MSLGEMLVSTEDMKGEKDSKIIPFRKYFEAVERAGMIKWLKDNIEKRPDKTIIAKVSDVAKDMGHDFEMSNPVTIYNGLKYVLFQNDIVVSLGFHKDGDRVFIMKEKKPGDKLPLSYKRVEDRVVRKAKRDEKYSVELNAKYEQILKEKDEVKKERLEIRKEKDSIYEEFLRERNNLEDEFRKERKSLQETIKKLKEELGKKREKRNCIVEVFKINWKTLEWKLIRQKMAKTEDTLLSMVREFTSKSPEERFRIEVTEINGIVTGEGEKTEEEIDIENAENAKNVKNAENTENIGNIGNIGNIEKVEKVEKVGEQAVIEIPEKA